MKSPASLVLWEEMAHFKDINPKDAGKVMRSDLSLPPIQKCGVHVVPGPRSSEKSASCWVLDEG